MMQTVKNADLYDGLDCGDPIRNLWAAVIRNALLEVGGKGIHNHGNCGTARAAQRSAMYFFRSPDSMLPFICEQMGVDLLSVRSRAEKLISGAKRKWN